MVDYYILVCEFMSFFYEINNLKKALMRPLKRSIKKHDIKPQRKWKQYNVRKK